MKVGLIHADDKMLNLALIKLSSWYKKRGDAFLIDLSSFILDLIYASQVIKLYKETLE